MSSAPSLAARDSSRTTATTTTTTATTTTTTAAAPALSSKDKDFRGKSGKKICCACPSTKLQRDSCVVERGEADCRDIIEKHRACLREDGFDV